MAFKQTITVFCGNGKQAIFSGDYQLQTQEDLDGIQGVVVSSALEVPDGQELSVIKLPNLQGEEQLSILDVGETTDPSDGGVSPLPV